MKKTICIILAVFLTLLCACTKSASDKAESKSEQKTTQTADENTVDLTKISSTLVYSELNNMMVNPDDYIGKTVIMKGKYGVYEGGGRSYYVCEVQDATACCTQGLEFVLKNPDRYPIYNPKAPKIIEIKGTFNTYTEDNQKFFQLEDAEIEY